MRSIRRSTLFIMLFSILTRLTSFFFKMFLSRKVGAEVLGLFQMATSVFGLFCTIASSGVPLMLSRKTAELSAVGKKEKEIAAAVTGATLFSLGIAFLLTIGAILFRGRIAAAFSDGRSVKIFYVILPALFSTVLYQIFRGYLMGRGRYLEYSLTEFSEEIIKIVVCLTFLSNALVILSESVALAIAFTVTDYAVLAILLILYFARGGRFGKPKGTKELVKASAPVTVMRIASGLISSFIAIALPAALVRTGLTAGEAAAEYGRAVSMAFSLLFAPLSLTGALSVVILPEAAALAAKNNWKELRTRVDDSIIFIFILTVLFYALFITLGESYGLILFKDAGAGKFISAASGMMIPAALSGLINTTLNSLGEEKTVFFAFVIAAALLIAEILILPRYIGVYALAVGECTFNTVTFIMGLCFLWRKKAFTAKIFRPAVGSMLFAFPTALMTKLTFMLCEKVALPLFLSGALATLFGCGFYFGLLLVFKPVKNLKAIILRNPARGKAAKRAA